MFATTIYRRRRLILVAAVLFTILAYGVGGTVAGALETGSSQFQDPASASAAATEILDAATGVGADPAVVALVEGGELQRVRDALDADPAVARAVVAGPDLVLAYFDVDADAESAVERLLGTFEGDEAVRLGGAEVASFQVGETVSADLARAELLAIPLILLLSFWVFRGLVAALLPPLVGMVSIGTTFLGLRVLTEGIDLSIFALNLVTALGLGLAIDYSLFVVSRFRDELAARGETRAALAATMRTAGRTVLFSSLTVAAAMASLLVFPLQFLYSMGIGGIFVSLASAVVALVVLPAVLAVLGPRVNAGSPARWKVPPSSGRWARLGAWVLGRPGRVALVSALALVVLALPSLRATFAGVDASVLPTSASARQVHDVLEERGDLGRFTTITVVTSAAPTSAELAALDSLPGAAAVGAPRAVGTSWAFDVESSSAALDGGSKALVESIRAALPAARVTGETAEFLDLQDTLRASIPWAVLVLALTTFVLLFLFTGSVVLPLKALVMNALTLAATFGAMVLLFDWGAGQGGLESTQPILLAAIAFGLSTDYAVFLLSRIKEARDAGHDDREAVGIGLERTGRIITAAALLFCVAVGAFATSSISFIQQVGVGTAIAVALDATVVRAFLVPSLMGLLGRWNWWAPKPLLRLHTRLGLAH